MVGIATRSPLIPFACHPCLERLIIRQRSRHQHALRTQSLGEVLIIFRIPPARVHCVTRPGKADALHNRRQSGDVCLAGYQVSSQMISECIVVRRNVQRNPSKIKLDIHRAAPHGTRSCISPRVLHPATATGARVAPRLWHGILRLDALECGRLTDGRGVLS